jgi:hypothetical protein
LSNRFRPLSPAETDGETALTTGRCFKDSDYIPSRAWQYDIDAAKPYTLTISWLDERIVEDGKVVHPALWP